MPEFEKAIKIAADLSREELPEFEKAINNAANKITDFDKNYDLQSIIKMLRNDADKDSSFIANPVKLKETSYYPIPKLWFGKFAILYSSLFMGRCALVDFVITCGCRSAGRNFQPLSPIFWPIADLPIYRINAGAYRDAREYFLARGIHRRTITTCTIQHVYQRGVHDNCLHARIAI